jgi:predicted ATPase/class 3 adenylate cyclase
MTGRTQPVDAPSGTLAIVFTDIQGSTELWERYSEGMREALDVHDRLLRELLAPCSGYEVKTQGDAFMVAFASAVDAVHWCLSVQEALLHAPWPAELLAQPQAQEERGPQGLLYRGFRVRMGVHVGEPERRIDPGTGQVDYFGRMVNLAARVAAAGHGGQVLLSGSTWEQVEHAQEALRHPEVQHLGWFLLKGIQEAIALAQVLPASLAERRFARPQALEEWHGNIPQDVGELIGREAELALLKGWFEEGARLVTLLGPGGMGKTRLSTHFGKEQLVLSTWRGGVWLCDLTGVTTAESLCHTVGQVLGIPLTREGLSDVAPAEQLGRVLGSRGAILVILDNMEHLIQHASATVGRWRVLAPQARFLVTSREAMGQPGERILDLAPLGLPAEGESRLEAIANAHAVRLFVQRAREARGSFELSAAEAPLAAEIVRRLDGIALAIELAAARTPLMGVRQIRDRLSHRFQLLRGGRRDASARQATLGGAIDWSWKLLEPAEQVALAQCAIFRGGFTLEAAEAVLSLPLYSPAVWEVIESLRSKSLLKAYTPEGLEGELRLGMYESIREYASAKLTEHGAEAALAARHADYYLTHARALRTPEKGVEGGEALRWLALERENLLAACDSAMAQGPATPESLERALGILVALEPDVTVRGPAGLTLGRLERGLELTESVSVDLLLRAEALAVRGRVHLELGQLAEAREHLTGAWTAFLGLGAEAQEKRVLVDLSLVAHHEGDQAMALKLIQEAHEIPARGNRWLEAYAVGNLGIIEQQRSGVVATIPHLRAAMQLFREVGDRMMELAFLTNCALAIGEAGRKEEALALLQEAADKSTGAGYRAGHAVARLNMGCFLLEEDRAEEASGHLEEAVLIGRQLGMRLVEGVALGELGRAALVAGAPQVARAHLTKAIALLAQVSRWHVLRFSTHAAAVHAALGELGAARERLTTLESAPELQEDPVLRELTSLQAVWVYLAEARAAPPGSEEARQAMESVRQRLERARHAPAEAASSDLRGALRLIERNLRLRDLSEDMLHTH